MDKSPDAYRTISEVAEDLDLPQHVLRFWETRFSHIRPLKRGGGRRYYRPDDLDLLRGIRHLLYGEGYTIRGVQKILKEEGPRAVQTVWRDPATQTPLKPDAARPASGPASPTLVSGHDQCRADGEDATLPDRDEDESPPLDRTAFSSGPGLSGAAAHQLQAALAELAECRRLINAARGAMTDEPETC